MARNNRSATATASWVLLAVLIGLGFFIGGRNLVLGEGRVLLGFGAAMFALVPVLVRAVGLRHPYRLYCLLYAFCIMAYDIGCANQGFDTYPMFDKVSHFLSGIVFTCLGFCVCLYINRRLDGRERAPGAFLLCVGALGISMLVAVVWEGCEFSGYLLTGHDSQHHLDTGVFDTMYDLLSCLAGSVLSIASYALTRCTGRRLLTGAVVAEFEGCLPPVKG